MNPLDWILLVLVALYALSGYWQGFVTGAFATAGLLLGGAFGVWLAPRALGDAEPSAWVSIGALFIVILAASLGQAIMQYAGAKVRDRITWQPVRAVDAVGGALLSACAVLLVAWALGVAISGSGLAGVTSQVRGSVILGKVNSFMPQQSDRLLSALNNVVGTTAFPRYLEPFAKERIIEVGPGDPAMLRDPDVRAAAASVLKVRAANACGRGIEGTGFVYADGRVMTNAHVVAGVRDAEVEVGGSMRSAEVVVYDPELDIAVLQLDTAGIEPLRFDFDGAAKTPVAILGYPEDGPFSAAAGRIRAQQRLRSPNIYDEGTVLRTVFSLRGIVKPGNSGGPIVSSQGEVLGMVFAASLTNSDTGYALTADQVRERAAQGVTSRNEVTTGGCVG